MGGGGGGYGNVVEGVVVIIGLSILRVFTYFRFFLPKNVKIITRLHFQSILVSH